MLAPLVLACVWAGGAAFLVLICAGWAVLLYEWAEMSRQARARAWVWLLALPYLLPGLVGLWVVRHDPVAGRWNVLFLLAVVWASDIGAYAAGRLVGGPKLAPSISPGKTWSGAAGGLLAAALVPVLVALPEGPSGRGVLLALVLGMASQAGDLAESAIKRGFGVKDSGRIMPGHGGLLDRVDGLVAAAPVAAVLGSAFGAGVGLWR